jgi:hypothetical protein
MGALRVGWTREKREENTMASSLARVSTMREAVVSVACDCRRMAM